MISIIIPSRNEIFLKKTIIDILQKAAGEIEVLPVLDGYKLTDDEIIKDIRVKYLHLPKSDKLQKRHAVQKAVSESKGEFIMCTDAHCMFETGFDEVLLKDLEKDWVSVPRRMRLDAEKWSLLDDPRPPVDYEYIMYPGKFNPIAFHGFRWDERTIAREKIKIDDIITFQGSCWIMHKKYFLKRKMMDPAGWGGWGQEAEEISFKTWLTGGRVIVNKNTWYAHLHKGGKFGRMYFMDRAEVRKNYLYSWDYWFYNKQLPERVHNFKWLVEKFWPLPGWPSDWEKRLGYKD